MPSPLPIATLINTQCLNRSLSTTIVTLSPSPPSPTDAPMLESKLECGLRVKETTPLPLPTNSCTVHERCTCLASPPPPDTFTISCNGVDSVPPSSPYLVTKTSVPHSPLWPVRERETRSSPTLPISMSAGIGSSSARDNEAWCSREGTHVTCMEMGGRREAWQVALLLVNHLPSKVSGFRVG